MEGALKSYLKAGKITQQAKNYARSLIKPGMSVLELADKIENKIRELGGKLAFPVNISINELAAHYVPHHADKTVIREGDLVKIDIGVHINGYIADTAFSVALDEKDRALVNATELALKSAIKTIKPGIEVWKVGEAIASEILKAGFQPIRNLTGHLVEQYNLHAGLSIPNYNNHNRAQLKEGMVLAIEPFATYGEGFVIEGRIADVYKLEKVGIIKAKDILNWIIEQYKTLPFAKRWLVRKFGLLKSSLALREGCSKGLFKQYKILREKSSAKVAQAEHTVIIGKKIKVIT